MSFIWHTLFFDPIYNCLVFFIDTIPGGDIGLAIIIVTLVVKLILLPLSVKASKTQRVMKALDPKLKELQERHKDDREVLARATMDAYKEAGINPFSSIFLMLLQIPIIIALYFAVGRGGGVPFPEINTAILYAFVPIPETVNMIFLGIVDIAAKSWPLALLAGITQFIYGQLSVPALQVDPADGPSLKADFARSMNINMRYVMPVMIGFVAYTLSASVALYFTTSSVFAIVQEFVLRRHR